MIAFFWNTRYNANNVDIACISAKLIRGRRAMRIDKEFILREIAGDYIIIPAGKTVLDFNGLITVNEVGVSLWNMLQNEVTFEELVQGILDEYDVEESVAREDVQEFLAALIDVGIITKDQEDEK